MSAPIRSPPRAAKPVNTASKFRIFNGTSTIPARWATQFVCMLDGPNGGPLYRIIGTGNDPDFQDRRQEGLKENPSTEVGRAQFYSRAAGVLDLVGGACAWGCAGAASGVAMEMPYSRHRLPTTWNTRSKLICCGRVGM